MFLAFRPIETFNNPGIFLIFAAKDLCQPRTSVEQLWKWSPASGNLAVHISNDLTWSANTSHLLRKPTSVSTSLGSCGVPDWGAPSWGASTTVQWRASSAPASLCNRQLHCCGKEVSAKGGEGCTEDCGEQPSLHLGPLRLTICIVKDSAHPAHNVFLPLPSGRQLRSFQSKPTRLRNSFLPAAVRLLNSSCAL